MRWGVPSPERFSPLGSPHRRACGLRPCFPVFKGGVIYPTLRFLQHPETVSKTLSVVPEAEDCGRARQELAGRRCVVPRWPPSSSMSSFCMQAKSMMCLEFVAVEAGSARGGLRHRSGFLGGFGHWRCISPHRAHLPDALSPTPPQGGSDG